MPRQKSTEFDRHVGVKLKERRKALGWSQTKLGVTLDVTYQQVQKYENGSSGLSAMMLERAATALDTPLAFFIPPRRA